MGTVTAGNAPGITDGAAATVVASERAVEQYGLRPLARIVGYAQAEVAPKWLFLAPVQGVKRLLDRIELPLEAFDLIEINEAFAAQTIADGRELGFDWDRVNVNGGAIALGHPIGASGARIVATLLHELRATRGPLRARDALPRRRRVRRHGGGAGRGLSAPHRRDARPAARPAARRHAARPDDRDDRHRHLERLVRGRRAASTRSPSAPSARRPTRRSSCDVWKHEPARLAGDASASSPRSDPDGTEVDLAWAIVDEMSRPGGAAARSRRSRRTGGRQGRLSMQTDPTLFRLRGPDARPGRPFRRARPEHHRQVPGDRRRDRGDGGGDRRGDQRQRDGLLQRRPGGRRGRGDRARPAPARGRRPADDRWARSSRS